MRKTNNFTSFGFVFFLTESNRTPSDDEHRKQSRGTERRRLGRDGQLPPGRRLSPGNNSIAACSEGDCSKTLLFLCVFLG
ncbi:hypothetical protein CEXT_562261 [Caerostris extrusa]|uniref:Uncharacterized protein n=1 Tax=Caerostris extrusa TaxID=172846 RepID=A0AAV4SN18_CAEEX|nr:hypothetical protein CEXT_562261 [Caerostris extrusa]